MIPYVTDRWICEEDLATPIAGRDDSESVVWGCIRYLRARSRGGVRMVAAGVDEKARNALVHARVQTAAISPRVRELERQLIQQEATITRLLAFVPARFGAVHPARLQEIVELVKTTAEATFADHRVETRVLDEREAGTEACHRIEVVVHLTFVAAVESLVAAEVALRTKLVEFVSGDELRALRLLIDFQD